MGTTTTSKKFREFTSEPLGEKLVTDVPGIGVAIGTRLSERNMKFAYHILSLYLSPDINMQQDQFVEWLIKNGGSNKQFAKQTFEAIKTLADNFIF
jgi:hypothetical protein